VRLSRPEKRLLALFAVLCGAAALLVYRPRPAPAPPPDPLRQPTPLYPHANAAVTYRFDPDWPPRELGGDRAELTGVAVDADDRVWVLGLGQPPVRLYDAGGTFVRGWGAGLIEKGHQIRLDAQGNVWVVDCGRHCVHKFLPDGTRLLTLGTPGEPGEDATHFHEPTDVAVTPAGDAFVADGYVNARVARFRGDGTFVKAWGGRGHRPGEFSLVHAVVADRRGRLLVADRNNARVQLFDPDGKFLGQWCNLLVPWGLAVTPGGEVWACGSSPAAWREDAFALATPPHDQLLMKFDPDGRVLQLWAVPVGDGPGQFNWVHAVAVDSRGNLFCGDYHGKRVQKLVPVPPAAGAQP
jgi:streptogramin lyase